MKNAIRTFAMLLALGFTASAFATTTPAMNEKHDASGTFKCTIIQPLALEISGEAIIDLGELLPGETKTTATPNSIAWSITGALSHTYYYKIEAITEDGTGDNKVTLTMNWTKLDAASTAPVVDGASHLATLKSDGTSLITATVPTVVAGTAAALGERTFAQKVTVSYATF